MRMITANMLRQIMPQAGGRADIYAIPLHDAMEKFGIDTPTRQAAFIAQLAHESGQFRYVRELASGQAYEGRADLGNTEPGDGVKFRGRGLIQITGRANYIRCGEALGLDLTASPELLELPHPACDSAAWFWQSRNLNALADEGDFVKITKRINGGTNGLSERLSFYGAAKGVLGG